MGGKLKQFKTYSYTEINQGEKMFHKFLNIYLILGFMLIVVQASDINICENVADNILLQDIGDCSKYISCMNRKPKFYQCKNSLYFDVVEQNCTASRSSCFQCNQGDLTLLPLSKTCDKYVLCFDGNLTVQQCHNNLQFNPKIGKCDLQKNVDCVANQCSNHALIDNLTYIPSAASCENYYVCMRGQPRALSCAPGLYFSTKCNCCDNAENVSCSISKTNVQPPADEYYSQKAENADDSIKTHHHYQPTVISESANINCPKMGTFILPHYHRNQYYLCLDGKASVLACPQGRLFDEKLKACRDLIQ